jgi:hypothetical protein
MSNGERLVGRQFPPSASEDPDEFLALVIVRSRSDSAPHVDRPADDGYAMSNIVGNIGTEMVK